MTRILPFVFLLLMGMMWNCVNSTCVFETDFGLSINCGLKKSGMFRVRNLGGLKGYVGLGIQLADELGFKESLSTLEQNSKRRSVNGFPVPGSFEPLAVPQNNNQVTTSANNNNQDRSAYAKMNGRTTKPVTVPPFRPLVTAANNMVRNVRLAAQQQQQQQQQPLLKPLPVPAFAALPESIAKVTVETPKPPVAVVTPSMSRLAAIPVQMMQPQIPQTALMTLHQPILMSSPTFMQQQQQLQQLQQQQQQQLLQQRQQPQPQQQQPQQQQSQQQQPQPQQISPVYYHNAMQQAANRRFNAFTQNSQNSIEARPIIVMPVAATDNRKKPAAAVGGQLSNEVDPASMMSLFNVAAANNVSVEQLALALRHQQQLRAPQSGSPIFVTAPVTAGTTSTSTTTTTTTTTTTPPPPPPEEPSPVTKKITIKPYRSKYGSSGQKVMNAPSEYYPVGYDKNFDDHFASKVDLPDTSFSCGDQKHFPGLYGDEDLGCMVFHVCAFTDEGLTQKSFLCPESTLFDQTILKCNWWFYVDCKSSKKLYDSNIPISKSYQLMKALTFFSSYAAGPTVDDSVAAATAAVSSHSDYAQVSGATNTATTEATTTTTSTTATHSSEVLDNISVRR